MAECAMAEMMKHPGVMNKVQDELEKVEKNPIWQYKKLLMFCNDKGVTVTAYFTMGAKGYGWVPTAL
ncbi:hypothetical protein GIB67_042349 [Kingdonia uniflora]|uniref:Uncharacterized protein n=1 Tax=Kingdonia uniflora TaxID=39325 RepID=A0A7J7M5G4_9MAGN|nr:hypothetical protein GIB67_042349 [Kingdonia uniflora]